MSIAGALMRGVGDAGSVFARGLLDQEEERRRREERIATERALIAERAAASRAPAAGGGRAAGVLMSPEQETEYLAAAMGTNQPELQRFREAERTGDYSAFRPNVGTVVDDEYGQQPVLGALPPEFEEFKKRKRAELAKALETVRFTDDIDKIAKGRQTDTETDLLGRSARGERGATEALLANRGRDPLETSARAERQGAEADRARRPPTAGGGGRASAPPVERLTSQLSQLRMLLKQEQDKQFRANPELIRQYQEDINDVTAQLRALRAAPADGAPRAAPAPAAPAAPRAAQSSQTPPANMLREGVQTRFRNGQVWTLRDGKPVRIQ